MKRQAKPKVRNAHDPEGRKQAIVQATAKILVRKNAAELTHRKIAEYANVPLGSTTYYFASLDELYTEALAHLASEADKGLAEIADAMRRYDGNFVQFAGMLHQYLTDKERIKSDAALYVAGLQNPQLKALSLRWFEGLAAILARYTTTECAAAIALFCDGLLLNTALAGKAPDKSFIVRYVTRLAHEHNERES